MTNTTYAAHRWARALHADLVDKRLSRLLPLNAWQKNSHQLLRWFQKNCLCSEGSALWSSLKGSRRSPLSLNISLTFISTSGILVSSIIPVFEIDAY